MRVIYSALLSTTAVSQLFLILYGTYQSHGMVLSTDDCSVIAKTEWNTINSNGHLNLCRYIHSFSACRLKHVLRKKDTIVSSNVSMTYRTAFLVTSWCTQVEVILLKQSLIYRRQWRVQISKQQGQQANQENSLILNRLEWIFWVR